MVPLNMYILPNYGKTSFIVHFKNLKFKYFYAFVGDQSNIYTLSFYITTNRFVVYAKESILFSEMLR